jgi:hypothetical protein
MRRAQLHRQNSAFVRSSSLGEVHAKPVIQEVTLTRGNGSPRLIVKDGHIMTNSFNFPIYSTITFNARLIGAGYFYATFHYNGQEHLAFVTRADSKVTYTIDIEKKLHGLSFHISPTIPTHYSPAFIDPASRALLRSNPQSFNQLGFMPAEPSLDVQALPSWAKGIKMPTPAAPALTPSEGMWGGRINSHSWKYGRSGSDITKGQKVKWIANYDAGWLGTSSVYKYLPDKGWECIQQPSGYLQVGQPHCIVSQLVGYRDTTGIGGEYHPYTDNGSEAWSGGETIRGDRIRLMEQSFANGHGKENSKWHGKNKHKIQDYYDFVDGGKVPLNFDGDIHYPISKDADKYCAKVEWWNPNTNVWSEPAIHPPWTSYLDSQGAFAFYFRFPRQLTENDEFYEKTPQWQWEKTWDAYPSLDRNEGDNSELIYTRIGRPTKKGTTDLIVLEYPPDSGNKVAASKTTPMYYIMVAPESKSEDGGDKQKEGYIRTSGNSTYTAVDPYAYSYADNPDILKAYWTAGNFKPGGTFMLLGKALDMFPAFWVSTKSLKTKGSTPMDLGSQQHDFVRGEYKANQFAADKLPQPTSMKAVDVDDPKKVAAFQPQWDKCFPGVPLTKPILTAILRGDQLPELEGIENKTLPGFLDDDPLRYETTYGGQTYKHSYTLSLCTIPEGWWGPSVDITQTGEGDTATFASEGPKSVYFGGANFYYYIKEEQVNLADEIEYQLQLESQGLIAAEAFAASELENPMVDITFEAYKNRNETVEESINAPLQDEKWWLFRTEQVRLKHRKFSLLGGTTVSDVTNKYSADHTTNLDGVTDNNVTQYGFDELYLIEGIKGGPSTVVMPPAEPTGGVPIKHSNVADFGNSGRAALKARALGQGNPMKYSTEEKQDNFKVQQMGGVIDDALGFDEDTIRNTVIASVSVVGAALVLGGIIKIAPLINNMKAAKFRREEAETRANTAEIDFLNKVKETRN